MIGVMVVLLEYFLGMVWFQVYIGSSAILENGYENQGQNCVARFHGRILWVWCCYRNFVLSISCFRWIVFDTFKWPNEQQSFVFPWIVYARKKYTQGKKPNSGLGLPNKRRGFFYNIVLRLFYVMKFFC